MLTCIYKSNKIDIVKNDVQNWSWQNRQISIPYIKYVTICSNLQHLTSKFLSTIQDFDPRFDCQVFCPRLFDWLKLERSTYFHVLGHLSGESSEAQSVLTSGLPSQEPWSIVTCMFEELKNYVPNCLIVAIW